MTPACLGLFSPAASQSLASWGCTQPRPSSHCTPVASRRGNRTCRTWASEGRGPPPDLDLNHLEGHREGKHGALRRGPDQRLQQGQQLAHPRRLVPLHLCAGLVPRVRGSLQQPAASARPARGRHVSTRSAYGQRTGSEVCISTHLQRLWYQLQHAAPVLCGEVVPALKIHRELADKSPLAVVPAAAPQSREVAPRLRAVQPR